MIRAQSYNSKENRLSPVQPEQIAAALQDEETLLWVDIFNEPTASSEALLLNVFGLHALSVEDALAESQLPKVEDWDDYLYIVMDGVEWAGTAEEQIRVPELDVFLGLRFIVTHHSTPVAALDNVWDTCQRDGRIMKHGADHVLYRLAHEQAMQTMTAIEQIDEILDRLEDEIFARARPSVLEEMFTLKRTLLQLRRTVVPQREVFNKLARDPVSIIDEKDRIYFRDIFDHYIWLQGLIENLRDLVGGAMDTYLSVVNNRMNDTMRVLTMITTLFMPLAFITGFFGMNFFQAANATPSWTDTPILLAALSGMVLTPLALYWWMKRKGLG